MRPTPSRLVILAAAALIAAGCGSRVAPESPWLRAAAASDLQDAFPALAEAYAKQTGEPAPRAVFGASGVLARQVEQGAPVDLFLSADRGYVDDLAGKGILDRSTVGLYARGSLVIVARADGPTLRGIADLARPEFRRVAIANPEAAPYGRAARAAMQAAGVWEGLKGRVVQAENVRQALQLVRTGNAEAAFVGRALVIDETELEVVAVDPELHPPIDQALGVVAGRGGGAGDPRAVRFAAFVRGAEGQAVLRRFGFAPPL